MYAPAANFAMVGEGASAKPYVYIRAGGYGCTSFTPTSLAKVEQGQVRTLKKVEYNTDKCRQEPSDADVDANGQPDDTQPLYIARNGDASKGENPARIYLFRNFHAAEAQLGVSDYTPTGTAGLGISRYELTMRRPVASWTVDDARYFVDAEGVTFEKNYYENPKVAVVDNSGAQIEQGSAIASSRLLSFVGRVIALAAEQNMTITKIEIPSESMRQIHVTGRGIPQVRMTTDRAVEVQVNDMVTAVRHLRAKNHSVRYVDVRVEGKAFYR